VLKPSRAREGATDPSRRREAGVETATPYLTHTHGLLFLLFFSHHFLFGFNSGHHVVLPLRGEDAGEGGELVHGMLETNAAVVRPGSALDPAAGAR